MTHNTLASVLFALFTCAGLLTDTPGDQLGRPADAGPLAGTHKTARISFLDCNHNGIEDALDIAQGYSPDDDENGIPDECQDHECYWFDSGRTLACATSTRVVRRTRFVRALQARARRAGLLPSLNPRHGSRAVQGSLRGWLPLEGLVAGR